MLLLTLCPVGCEHLAAQMWEESVVALQPLRAFMHEACELFPAYLGPFLRLATGLVVGQTAAQSCYDYLSKDPPMVVEFEGPHVDGLQVRCRGSVLKDSCRVSLRVLL